MQEALGFALRAVVVCHALAAESFALHTFPSNITRDLRIVGRRTLFQALPLVKQGPISAGSAHLCVVASVAVTWTNHLSRFESRLFTAVHLVS